MCYRSLNCWRKQKTHTEILRATERNIELWNVSKRTRKSFIIFVAKVEERKWKKTWERESNSYSFGENERVKYINTTLILWHKSQLSHNNEKYVLRFIFSMPLSKWRIWKIKGDTERGRRTRTHTILIWTKNIIIFPLNLIYTWNLCCFSLLLACSLPMCCTLSPYRFLNFLSYLFHQKANINTL